jgi:hypothetical protein
VKRHLALVAIAGATSALLLAAACSASSNDPAQRASSTSDPATTGQSPNSRPTTTAPTKTPPTNKPVGPAAYFTPKKLKPGEKPPQFIVLSFDGVGWHEKWQFWHSIAQRVPLRFTGFLTGLYLLDEQHKTYYHGPGHLPGHSSLGAWNTPADVVQEVKDLNNAYSLGDEIGTHYMGHFCDDNPPGATQWTTADWNSDLNQFFDVFRNYKKVDNIPGMPTLKVPASTIKGERTPCLEGRPDQLFPALEQHKFLYDSSPDRAGIAWPQKVNGVWRMGMADFPLAGTDHRVITMDYNFWYAQEQASSTVAPAKSKQDTQQIFQTYMNMYGAAYNGNRAPLILGNHFEQWNNNAYTNALAQFALKACGRPNTYCVPFIDVVRWMQAQDPKVLAHLQALPPEMGPRKGN